MTPDDDRTARRYSSTEAFANTSAELDQLSVCAWLGIGALAAAASAFAAAALGHVALYWVFAGITLPVVAIGGCVAWWSRVSRLRLRSVLDAGPYLTIGDAGLMYAGTRRAWADIEEIHISDFRSSRPAPGITAPIMLEIELTDAVHALNLDEMLPPDTIDVLLHDLRRTATAHGATVTASRTMGEYRAWVKADPRI